MKSNAGAPDRPAAERHGGVDFMRGFAAFGVICVHAGIPVENHIAPAAAALQAWFDFVVPFFLVASFYFAIRGEKGGPARWGPWLRNRSARLLVPYVIWSAIYLGLHGLKLALQHQGASLRAVLQDPAGLLLDGGTGLALYFLPLLFVGLVIAHAARGFLTTAPLGALIAALVVATALAELMYLTGNGYDLGTAIGFTRVLPQANAFAPARIVLALLAHGVRCLPLIVIAAILIRLVARGLSAKAALATGAIILALPLLRGFFPMIDLTPEFIIGAGAFLLGWGLPLASSKVTTMLGAFAFGVYLVHQVVLEAMQVAAHAARLAPTPAGPVEILVITVIGFGISMAIVGVASRCGIIARRVFALP